MGASSPPIDSAWRQLPNAISVARLVCVPLLAWLAWQGHASLFGPLFVAALVSDIVDGWIARRFGFASPRGARLDSLADTALFLVSLYALWAFHPRVVIEYPLATASVAGLWILENVASLWRYGRLSSFHTYLSKAAAYALGIFLGWLFLFGFVQPLMASAVCLAVLASLEELALLALLPQWRTNVRGLWWVWRSSRSASR